MKLRSLCVILMCSTVPACGKGKSGGTKPPTTVDATPPKVTIDTGVKQEPDPPEIAAAQQDYFRGEFQKVIDTLGPLYDDLKSRNQYRASGLTGAWLALAHAEIVFDNGKEPAEWAASMADATGDNDVAVAAKLAMGAYRIGNHEFAEALTALDPITTASADAALIALGHVLRAEALIGGAFSSGEDDTIVKPENFDTARTAYDAAAAAAKGNAIEQLLRGRVEEGYAALANYRKQRDQVCQHAVAALGAFISGAAAPALVEGAAQLASDNRCDVPPELAADPSDA